MVDFRPSTYTPLFRRFDNEKAKELEETRRLYQSVKLQQDASNVDYISISKLVYPVYRHLPEDLVYIFNKVLGTILLNEPYLVELPPLALDRMNLQEFVEYRNLLYAKEYFFKNELALQDVMAEALQNILGGIAQRLPEFEAPSPFTIPLMYLIPDAKMLIDEIHNSFLHYRREELFNRVADQFYENYCEVSGRTDRNSSRPPLQAASQNPRPLDTVAEGYLFNTPFLDLYRMPVPLKLTHEDRFSHMHIVGGTGAGKTTLIENLILHDICADDPPSIVLIDPHSDLVRKLFRADLGIEDRVILIDPRDIQYPPAINPFAINRERLDSYDEATREQVTAGVIQTFSYLFGSLFNLDLTGKQSVFFRYCVRLLLSLPDTMGRNATIIDMLNLMADDTPYRAAIKTLPDIQREFFERDFKSKTFQTTKEQIRYRLQAIIENPTMARLFTATETKVDLFTEMNRGAIILVDTAKDFLKDNSAVYGQLLISLVLQAVIERAAIAESQRKPTFLYVDEAASFFSSNIDDLLTEARKFKTGLVLAHQYMEQASSSLKASLAANTNIKLASGLSASDARMMAPDMRTTPDFILGQPKLQFATHIRNVTPSAVSIPISPAGALPLLSDEALAALIARNRATTSVTDDPEPEHEPNPIGFGAPIKDRPVTPERKTPMGFQRPSKPDEDISSDW